MPSWYLRLFPLTIARTNEEEKIARLFSALLGLSLAIHSFCSEEKHLCQGMPIRFGIARTQEAIHGLLGQPLLCSVYSVIWQQ